jgi:hypothetical protein
LSTRSAAAVGAVILAAIAWVAWQSLWAHGGDRELAWVDVTARTLAEPPAAGLLVLRSRTELEEHLPTATAPPIDFNRRTALLVSSGPRSSTAYDLEVVSVVEERRRIVVRVRERTPSLASPGRPALAFPYRLITIEASRKPVDVDRIGRP